MSKRCKARNKVIAELDFIHGMTHNLREVVDEADWPKEVWEEKAKVLKEVQNTIVDFLKDIDENEYSEKKVKKL
tara:strand:+ start:512 stop:733 length:222 start_codon:yes stop_codon:yes gene_type:complete